MLSGVDKIISDILVREGGYSDRAADRGGPTNFGITMGTLSAWRKHHCTAQDVHDMTVDEARQIYLHRYVVDPGFDHLGDTWLRELIVDAAVNHGVHEACILLQRSLSVQEDGIIGIATLKALGAVSSEYVWFRFMGYRLRFYAAIIAHDSTQAENGPGWLNRMAGILSQYSGEMFLEAGGSTAGSRASLQLAGQIGTWAKNLGRQSAQDANGYFLRAGSECLQASAKFR